MLSPILPTIQWYVKVIHPGSGNFSLQFHSGLPDIKGVLHIVFYMPLMHQFFTMKTVVLDLPIKSTFVEAEPGLYDSICLCWCYY